MNNRHSGACPVLRVGNSMSWMGWACLKENPPVPLDSGTRGWRGFCFWVSLRYCKGEYWQIVGRGGHATVAQVNFGWFEGVNLCGLPKSFFPTHRLHSLRYSLRLHFPLVLSFSPFMYDSARLSRILGMCFLAGAESELSHFTDGTVVRVRILSEDVKRDCEHSRNTIILGRRAVRV